MSQWQIHVQHINNMLDNCSSPGKPLPKLTRGFRDKCINRHLQCHGKFVLVEPPDLQDAHPLKVPMIFCEVAMGMDIF